MHQPKQWEQGFEFWRPEDLELLNRILHLVVLDPTPEKIDQAVPLARDLFTRLDTYEPANP